MSILKNLIKTDKRCLRIFLMNMVVKGILGFIRFRKRIKNGSMFPAFQFISVTNNCNLHCQGCWVEVNGPKINIEPEKIDAVIRAGKKYGSYFFGILGGEPLLYDGLFDIFEKHPDCYFQLFTNGTLLTKSTAQRLRRAGNVTPLISLEGDEYVADIRRGGHRIYNRTVEAIETSVSEGLITGVAISVCKSNFEMAVSDEFVNMLHDSGVIYLWYYIYRPSGSDPHYELALNTSEITKLRNFIVDARTRLPLILIDSYWNEKGIPFCPAIAGLSHHINPSGDIEPCPVIQLSCENLQYGEPGSLYENSLFLREFKEQLREKTNGCILMEDPAWLVHFSENHKAKNTSNRENYLTSLLKAPSIPSHSSSPLIPEKKLLYRIAKKTAFFGLGAYG
ncbi:MAG TPA: radical SAM/SPASM domain-containing protein [Bacteroidales bacterium]|nr:radical SAM/SPASM domain-containing protein [Bacteroidales bacterium]HOM40495.1 radical SAM/SPASM domain-containing protein [Bacteroidales bacterium]HQG55584.1 radical SAM/SPASM domain-containing protein [Bacteroidales bacterium]HRU56981.1 radical SAM/SPASM domain-containing protein [Bacteroidales bacterium]